MTWERRYRWRLIARTSLVLWAIAALATAMLCTVVIRRLDQETGWTGFGYTRDGARALLDSLSGSMLTFIVFVLSATLIVVQLASGQLSPRVIAFVLSGRSIKIAASTLTFTYAYTLSAMSRVEDRVPEVHVAVAVVLNLVCIIVFFRFVQQLSGGLRPASLMLMVAERGQDVIDAVYPIRFDPGQPEHEGPEPLPSGPASVIEFGGRSGVIMAVGTAELARLAARAGAVVELIPNVGDYIARGGPLFRVWPETAKLPADVLMGCVAVGAERTLDQDPRFVFRILVDIANKALSPAINDPTTAVLALDQINHLLLSLGRRRLDSGVIRDALGNVRLVYRTPDWHDFVILAVSEIRHYGEGSIQVARRLRALLEHLIAALPEVRRAPLRTELALLERAAARNFADEVDRKRANEADFQGVGGADS